MVAVGVDSDSRGSGRLTAQGCWLSLRVGSHLSLFYICQMNLITGKLSQWLFYHDSTTSLIILVMH